MPAKGRTPKTHGMRNCCFERVGLPALAVLLALARPASAGVSKAFRISDLDLRDPHVYVSFLGCRDFTDTAIGGLAFNGALQTSIQTDSEPDGKLDQNLLLVFDPLDPSSATGALRFGSSTCTAPIGTTVCGPNPTELLVSMTAVNAAAGSCLGALAGTTVHSYTPAITLPSSPCFSSDEHTLTLNLIGIPMTLRHARIAASYTAAPTDTLVKGLIRGFLSEADANTTIIPATFAIIGGQPLSQLFPGGDPPGAGNINCASWSDKDLGPDGVTPGWWMYFNFTATTVPYTGPQLDAPAPAHSSIALAASPSPFRSSVAIEYTLARGGRTRIVVHDLLGREVARLGDGHQEAGVHRLTWDGSREDRTPAAPGVYAIRLSSGTLSASRMVVRVQ